MNEALLVCSLFTVAEVAAWKVNFPMHRPSERLCGNNRKPKVSLQSLGLCLCIQCGSRGNLALGNYVEAGRSLEVQRMDSLCVGGVGMWCVLYASVARLFPLNVH